jgi:hypothetical protein
MRKLQKLQKYQNTIEQELGGGTSDALSKLRTIKQTIVECNPDYNCKIQPSVLLQQMKHHFEALFDVTSIDEHLPLFVQLNSFVNKCSSGFRKLSLLLGNPVSNST